MSFLSELKRRNVFRVATVYAATAFVILQAASVTFEPLHLPPWAMTLVVVLAIVGFPIAVIIAWAFELSPEGIQRTAEVADPAGAAVPHKWIGKRTVAAVAVLVVLGVGLGAGWFLRPAASGLMARGDDPVTLAVLPFDNLSGDPATEPFVVGVHDDLLTQLSRFDGLRVISRTSVMEYRQTTRNIREIASELGAGAIVEGGIQRSGNQVRINVQLIDARTDEHLWAETYQRELTAENVFAIQAEIAQSVAAALRAELAPGDLAELAEASTSSLEALEAYHAGRQAFDGGTDQDRGVVATAAFERAVEIDPEFAAAWAGLVASRSWFLRIGDARDTVPARQALDRTRSLDPDGIETRLAAGYYHYYARADFPRAYQEFLAAHRDAPHSASVVRGLALVERRLGKWEETVTHQRESVQLDPRAPNTMYDVGHSLARMRRYPEAREAMERAVRIAPVQKEANEALFGLLMWLVADTAAARAFAQERAGMLDASQVGKWRADLALARRDYDAARRELNALPAETPDVSPFIGYYAGLTRALPVLRARLAWLSGDREAAARHADEILRWADASPFVQPGYDPWRYERDVHLLRALAYAFRGDAAAALAEAERVPVDIERDAVDDVQVLDHLVVVWIAAGDTERALAGLERLMAVPAPMGPARLRMDPTYDSLRSDPRFQRLVAP